MLKFLWVRLSLAFSAVVFVSFILVTGLSFLIIRANLDMFDSAERLRVPDGMVDHLAQFYADRQSWAGVDAFFAGVEGVFRARPGENITFALVDDQGHSLYGTPPASTNDPQVDISALPVVVNGQTQASLIVSRTVDVPDTPRPFFVLRPPIRLDEIILLVAFVGGVIGILFGILMSRTLIAPLDELATAAGDIGAGNLDRRVQVQGSREVMSLAQSFNDMVAKLERVETLRRNMVADVAHELRTPVTALQANIYAILDDAYPMTKTEIAGLYDQTRLLSRLVDDLHELSLAEARQLPMNRRPLDFGETLEDFVAPFRSVVEGKDITLQVDLPDHLPTVLVDEDRIKQVLHNLLSNALRHTPAGGTITVTASHDDTCLSLAVKDTGDGIPPQHLANVFERFYRADFARSRQAGGSGLGLAIARAIVEAHDGNITVSSSGQPHEGATFTIQLPLYHGDPTPEAAMLANG